MTGVAWAGWLSAFMLLGFLVSNGLRGLGVPFYTSRKVAHFSAAVPIAISPFVFDSIWYPLGLALAFLLILVLTHNYDFFPGCARKGRWSECWFPFSIALSIVVLWSVSPYAAIAPALMLSLGDGITGIVRKLTIGKEMKGNWGSVACLCVCLVVGLWLVRPMWAGALGALAATIAEKYCGDTPDSLVHLDDNLTLPLAALAVIAPVVWLAG